MTVKLSTVYTALIAVALFLIAQIMGASADPAVNPDVAYARSLCRPVTSQKCDAGFTYRCTRHAYNDSRDPMAMKPAWSRNCGCFSRWVTAPIWRLEDQARYCRSALGKTWELREWAKARDITPETVEKWALRGPEDPPTDDDVIVPIDRPGI